jgi:cobalt-zinc-cadmium efflux system outer membrane protein
MTKERTARRAVALGGFLAVALGMRLSSAKEAGKSAADETGKSAAEDGVEVPPSAVKPDRAEAVPGGVVVPGKLTIVEATKLFRAKGLDLLIADTIVETAHGALLIARGFTNPAISVGIGGSLTYSPFIANGSGMGGPGLGGASTFTWNINVTDQACIAQIVFGKHGLNVKVARWAYEAAKMDRLDTQRQLEGGMKQQFAQTALAKVSIKYARENRVFSGNIFELVKNKYSAGAVSDADLAAAETDMLETEQAIAMAESNYYLQKVTLAFLLGSRTIASEYDLDEEFLTNKVSEPLEAPGARAQLVRDAFERRPDLKSIEYYRKSALNALALARRQRIPDIALWANYTMEGTGNSAIQPPTLTAGISTPLPIFYQQQGEIKQAEANLRLQDVTRAKKESQVANDLEGSRAGLQFAKDRIDRLEGRLMKRARDSRDLVKIQYDHGSASLVDLLFAERQFIQTKQEYLQAQTDYWTAAFQMEQALGRELRK